jgi:type II secretory pathway pseudopilin PulG
MHARRTRALRSYTLIELVMVIIILGLAAAILIPSLSNRDAVAVQASIRSIVGDLAFAASDAQANQEYRRVYFFDDGSGYCILRVSAVDFASPADLEDCPGTAGMPCAALDQIITNRFKGNRPYIVRFNDFGRLEGVSVTDTSIDGVAREITFDNLGGTVYFDGAGIVPGVGGYIELTFDDEVYRINIAPFTGKLTVQECPC